jgi:hypothetical protein
VRSERATQPRTLARRVRSLGSLLLLRPARAHCLTKTGRYGNTALRALRRQFAACGPLAHCARGWRFAMGVHTTPTLSARGRRNSTSRHSPEIHRTPARPWGRASRPCARSLPGQAGGAGYHLQRGAPLPGRSLSGAMGAHPCPTGPPQRGTRPSGRPNFIRGAAYRPLRARWVGELRRKVFRKRRHKPNPEGQGLPPAR